MNKQVKLIKLGIEYEFGGYENAIEDGEQEKLPNEKEFADYCIESVMDCSLETGELELLEKEVRFLGREKVAEIVISHVKKLYSTSPYPKEI